MLKEGDLVWVNKYSPSFSNTLIAGNSVKQQSLFTEYSLLAVITKLYTDMAHVYIIDTQEYKFIYNEDLKCQD